MPYSFQTVAVLTALRAFVKANLTAQGEAPTALPEATTASQIVLQAANYPATVLKPRTLTVDDMGTSSKFTFPIEVHHIRENEGGTGSATVTALTRLSALAAGLKNDPKMLSVGGDAIPVNDALPMHILAGEDNPVQMMLESTDQGASLTAAALVVEIMWYEGE